MTTSNFEQQLRTIDTPELQILLVGCAREIATTGNQRQRIIELAKRSSENDQLTLELGGMLSSKALMEAEREIADAKKRGVFVLSYFSEDYPQKLRSIEDPPLVLFVRGERPFPWQGLHQEFGVGVVGAREATSYGRTQAEKIGADVTTSGGYVVSGLALGIDGSAHSGAIRASRSSSGSKLNAGVAVLGSGVLSVYPSEHVELAYSLLENRGVIVSEYGLYQTPRAYRFPERNRIISGLSEVVIVVEAGLKSGAICTARLAGEQGRQVYAVPGPIDSKVSAGIIQLLRQGATPFLNLDDIFNDHLFLKKKDFGIGQKLEVAMQNPISLRLTDKYQKELNTRLSEIVVDERELTFARTLMKTLAEVKESEFDELVFQLSIEPQKLLAMLAKLQIIGVVEQSGPSSYRLLNKALT